METTSLTALIRICSPPLKIPCTEMRSNDVSKVKKTYLALYGSGGLHSLTLAQLVPVRTTQNNLRRCQNLC